MGRVPPLIEAFCRAFTAASGAKLVEASLPRVSPPEPDDFDAALSFTMPDRRNLKLSAELMQSAYPRDVRMLVDRYRRTRRPDAKSATVPFVVIAEALSPGARAFLREEGIYYFDRSGTLYFKSDLWVLDIERASNPRPRTIDRIFTAAREKVVHALLHQWLYADEGAKWISGSELAAKADVSAYTVSQLMKELERHDWIETRGKGPQQQRWLRDPSGLLDAWTEHWRQRKDPTVRGYLFNSSRAPLTDAVVTRLGETLGWMITGAAAANEGAPTLTSIERLELVIPGCSEEFLRILGIKPVEKGANVSLIERNGAALQFARSAPSRSDVIVASPLVQYLDLLNGYGRNKELAEAYRREVLHLKSDA